MTRLLLVSSSTLHGSGYLDYCAEAIASFLGPSVTRVLFVPVRAVRSRCVCREGARALRSDGVRSRLRPRFSRRADSRRRGAEALFIGGGNTFRLLDALWRNALVEPIRRRVRAGMPYVGTSAGSNVACPSIRTTNDMPIVEPPSFAALDLVPFNINAHYQDPIPGSTHMGETREQRIAEFHEENTPPVVGLREGAWLLVEGGSVVLQGANGARLFRRGEAPTELASGATLGFQAPGTEGV